MHRNQIKDYISDESKRHLLPFIATIIAEDGTVYNGVILNSDKVTVSFINLAKISNTETLYDFLELCLSWWWYSNKKIPINLFYPLECVEFLEYTTHIPQRPNVTIEGHIASLDDIASEKKPYKKKVSLHPRN